MITGSIVALVTPMTDSGDVDWRTLERLIDFHIENGTSALGLVGTTGEASTLSHPEHREVIRFGVSHAGGRIPIMAGTGSNSTLEAVELTVAAAEAGAASICRISRRKTSSAVRVLPLKLIRRT